MKIRLTAPDGYKYQDSLNNKTYSTIIIEDSERGRFDLVPDQSEQTVEM